jgi:preprotein translocase subunit SecA
MSIFDTIFGDTSTKFIKKSQKLVDEINNLESQVIELKDEDFPNKTKELKDLLEKGKSLDDILPMAFALVREAAKRNLKERHYDVQLLGGIALHNGNIVEMKTGEGKTLVATLPTYLNALTGKGVHIVTVNDYLARRDAVLMGQVYNFLGLSVGVINSQNVSYIYDPSHKEEDKERDQVGEFKVIYDFLKPVSRREACN